mgnify:CR=1 FL=1
MIRRKLSEVENGKKCKVVDCNGGLGMINKLDSLGIRIGKELFIINGSFMGGPSTVLAGSTRVAIGRNMASKIVVEVVE